MVQYWNWDKDAALARVGKTNDGSYCMDIQGEKHVYPGFPRGHLLASSLSKLKHEIKNQLFNEAWRELEEGISTEEIVERIKGPVLDEIIRMTKERKFDMVPPEKMCLAVKEIWRAWSKVEATIADPIKREKLKQLKTCLCFILQEDDAYRFRVQWLIKYFNPNSLWRRIIKRDIVEDFELALTMMEHAEVVGDMKERIRLLRRILLLGLKDSVVNSLFKQLWKEIDCNKVKLSKADEYYFRGKYFKVDFKNFDY